MPNPKVGKTGNAPITKQGQTSNGSYGDDPDAKHQRYGNRGYGSKGEKDLTPK